MRDIHVTPADDLQSILDSVGAGTRIFLEKGEYRQKIEINVPGIELIGGGADDTVIVYGDYAKKLDEYGKEYVTFRTYTVAVCADNVKMRDICVKNDACSPETKVQEVALTVYGDGFYAERCTLVSTQDTLFCGPLPPDLIERYDGFLKDKLRTGKYQKQIFKNCAIEGTVDFIFGCGDTLFENCKVISAFDARGVGYVAAPAHAESQSVGFVFDNCDFSHGEGVEKNSIFLARPWRDYGKSSLINCSYGDHIIACGFDKWNDTSRDKTARFAEYGTDRRGRVPWSGELSDDEKDILLGYFK
ncbi:MAG: pectin esterase [Clostridiales bacterium]|nr:pectin esterase [Clostridiales bacterium]